MTAVPGDLIAIRGGELLCSIDVDDREMDPGDDDGMTIVCFATTKPQVVSTVVIRVPGQCQPAIFFGMRFGWADVLCMGSMYSISGPTLRRSLVLQRFDESE